MVIIVSSYNATNTRFQFDHEIMQNHIFYAQQHAHEHDSECTQSIPWPYDMIVPNVYGKLYKIWNCLEKYPNDDIFWIDGDAIFANISLKVSDIVASSIKCALVAGQK